MKILCFALLSVLIAASHAISFSSIITVAMTLMSLNKPVCSFFGMFRRRRSPPIEETTALPEPQTRFFPGQQPISGGFFYDRFGFRPGGYYPGFGSPGFGLIPPSRFQTPFNRVASQVPTSAPPQTKQPQTADLMFSDRHRPQSQFPMQSVFPPRQPLFPQQLHMQQFPPQAVMQQMPSEMDDGREPREDMPGMNTEEAESFFTLLAETDENKCISRLVCEMGANPESGGEFGQTIVEIISSLNDFPDGSKVSEYNEILNIGVAEGRSSCFSKFSMCEEESYLLVKRASENDNDNEV